MKQRLKDKLTEVEVLKEMVKSANKQAKAKDIDIQRLMKKVQRLEKFNEINKGMGNGGGSQERKKAVDEEQDEGIMNREVEVEHDGGN